MGDYFVIKKNPELIDREVLEQIRAEIKKVYNEEKDIDVRWSQGLKYSLQIIDKYC